MRDSTGAPWFKSSRSQGQRDCVEVAFLGSGTVGVRDSKDPTGPALAFGPAEWDGFVAALTSGRFQR
ncbi:DUF397 domain-containing protein [Nocardia sp. NPDC051750]|jgi:hypothetical protein|uniref:DUF397 domain-containing protein n=1 Tax=Nocardia sp. NPDC051750 TaxID=3364325 RepID=UPI00378D9045